MHHKLSIMLDRSSQLSDLIRRLLSFSHVRANHLSLASRPVGITIVLGRSISVCARLTGGRRVRLILAGPFSRLVIVNSHSHLGRIFVGVVSGTIGCARNTNRILLTAAIRSSVIRVGVSSANINVPSRSLSHIGRGFCGTGGGIHKSNVKLTITSRVVGRVGNLLFVRDARNIKAAIAVILPLCVRGGRLRRAKRVSNWRVRLGEETNLGEERCSRGRQGGNTYDGASQRGR